MLNNTIKTILAGSKAAAVFALLGTTALAQTAVIETPEGTAVVPEAALTAESSVGIVAESDYPILEQWDNNEVVAETLIAQGFTDVYILREGPIMTVTAQRDGQPIELVYSVANGRLVSVNGVETREAPEGTSANDAAAAAGVATETTTEDTETEGTETDSTATDDGMADDSSPDAGTDTDTDAGSNTGSDTDTDGASDSDAGSDTGSDSDSGGDGGSDSDGGESDSDGSDGTNG